MRKLDYILPNYDDSNDEMDENVDYFDGLTQFSVKLEENYFVAKENMFKDFISQKEDMLNNLICFVKLIQRFLDYNDDDGMKIYVRYWFDESSGKKSAFTIGASNIPEHIDGEFNDLCKVPRYETQNVNLDWVLIRYKKTCHDERKTLYRNQNYVRDEEVLTFLNTFCYKNTKKLLSKGNYVPIVDFEIESPQIHFFWEAFGRSIFPWYYYNTFERMAKILMSEIEIENSVFYSDPDDLEVLAMGYRKSRYNWKTKKQLEESINEEVFKFMGKTEGDIDNEIAALDDNDDTDEARKERKKLEKDRRKIKSKAALIRNRRETHCNVPQYFTKPKGYSWKKAKEEKNETSNRVLRMTIHQMGRYQRLKEGLNILQELLCDDDDISHEVKQKVFNDFWLSQPVFHLLPDSVKSIYKAFTSERKPFLLLIVRKDRNLVHNILENLVQITHTILGQRNTAKQFILQLISRDTTFNLYDTLGYNLFIVGPPSCGKSQCLEKVTNCSILGTMSFNSMTESDKAGLGARNRDNWTTTVDLDAGPLFTQKWGDLNPDQKKKLKALIEQLSSNMTKYNVFVPGNGTNPSSDPFQRRGDTVRIANEKNGPNHYIANDLPKFEALLARLNLVNIVNDNNQYSSMFCKIASDLMNQFDAHKFLEDTFINFFKELQGDVALYNIYKTTGGGKNGIDYNVIVAMLVSTFCLKKLEEKHPFFICSPRKINSLMFIAITLRAYRVKVLLSNLQGSKYYGKKHINDIAEFCHEFSKRMIVGYEEIVPSLFLMLPQFIDNEMINILRVIKDEIFKFKHRNAKSYFRRVINKKANKINGYPIDFSKSLISKNGSSSYNFGKRDSTNKTFYNNNGDDFQEGEEEGRDGNVKFHVNPNFVEFKTEKSNDEFIRMINNILKRKFHYEMSEETIKFKLDKLKKKLIKVDNAEYFKTIEFSGTMENQYIDYKKFKLEKDDNPYKPHDVQCLFSRYDSRTKKNRYRFPLKLFQKLDELDSYDMLKRVIMEDLPYKNQGVDNIEVTAVKFPGLELENLTISSEIAENENFVISNPKKMTKLEQIYYDTAKQFYDEGDYNMTSEEATFYKMLLTKNDLNFDHPLDKLSYEMHGKSFGDLSEIVNEEELLLSKQEFSPEIEINRDKYEDLIEIFGMTNELESLNINQRNEVGNERNENVEMVEMNVNENVEMVENNVNNDDVEVMNGTVSGVNNVEMEEMNVNVNDDVEMVEKIMYGDYDKERNIMEGDIMIIDVALLGDEE